MLGRRCVDVARAYFGFAANGPVIDRSTVQQQINDFYVCNGFNVVRDFTIRRTAMEFPDRFVIHRDIDGTLTNSVTAPAFPRASTTDHLLPGRQRPDHRRGPPRRRTGALGRSS
jgi:hypothetical protein